MNLGRFVLVVAILSVGCAPSGGPTSEAPPNIIILLADDLGYGDLGSYGHPSIRTPNIDRLAAEGARFTSYYSGAPACTPARAALLTGRYAVRAGLPDVLMPESAHGLAAAETTIAEDLKTRGYRTMAVGKWHLGHSRPEYLPTEHGFDDYLGLPYSNDMIRPWVQTDVPLRMYGADGPIGGEVDQSTLTTSYTERAVRFVRESAGTPFFLYVAYNMPHLPIHPAPAREGQSRAGRYGDVVETLDWSVGRILAALGEEGIANETFVVFTSDNGPWLHLPERMLQEGNMPWHAGSPGPFRGSKGGTYEGGVRVPAVMRWPGRIEPGQVFADLATAMDLMPTVLAAAGVALPDDRPLDGQSLLPWLDRATPEIAGEAPDLAEGSPQLVTEAPPTDRTFYYFRGAILEAVREGRWKFRLSRQTDTLALIPEDAEPVPELYDLELDPSERYNVAEDHPDVVDRLSARIAEFEREVSRTSATPPQNAQGRGAP
jgi:arylsulfatase A-like enzyme